VTIRRLWTRLAVVAALVALVVILRFTVFAPDPLVVRVVAAEKGLVEETITNSRAGTVKARRRAKLAPETGGRVVALPHRRGSRVRKGEVLLRIDDSIQQAQLRVAEGDLATARAQRDQACLAAERAERERDISAWPGRIVSTDLLDQTASQARERRAACRARAGQRASPRSLARPRSRRRSSWPFDGIVRHLHRGGRVEHALAARDPGAVGDRRDRHVVDLRERAHGRGRLRRLNGPAGVASTRSRAALLPHGSAWRLRVDVEEQNRTVEIGSGSTTPRSPPRSCPAPPPTPRSS
jgi:multidrug efflux pump subunit AcrA (membrane-fusion protein)